MIHIFERLNIFDSLNICIYTMNYVEIEYTYLQFDISIILITQLYTLSLNISIILNCLMSLLLEFKVIFIFGSDQSS